jgi:hypothetical protein
MRKLVVLGAIGISIQGGFVAGGCAEASPTGAVDQDPVVRGTLRMDLTAVSDSGKVYRLRQASFPVSSFFSSSTITLSSETDPTKSVLEAFLNPGSYQIQLLDGWFVEQVDDLLGSAVFVPATLLSSSFQFFDIVSDTETFVKFEFEVDGQRVTFGPPGRLIVGIGVHERIGSCGNGVIDSGESCDGNDLGGQTCASATFGSLPNGFLFCSSFCALDITFCTAGDGGVGGAGGSFGGAGGFGGFGGTIGMDGSVGGTTSGGAPATGGSPATGGVSAGGSVSNPDAGASTGGTVGTGGRGRGRG